MIFNKKRAFEYGLILASVEVSSPDTKTTYIEVPFSDGSLDYTEYFGEPRYKDRTITMNFLSMTKWEDHSVLDSVLKNELHGKQMNIIFDDDMDYYWNGRISVGTWTYYKGISKVSITATVDPYKYKTKLTRVTRSITEETAIYLRNGRKTVCPEITTNASMTFVYDGKRVAHGAGTKFQIEDLILRDGGKTVTVIGEGTVTFEYREGSL